MKQLIQMAGFLLIVITTQGQKWQTTIGYPGTLEEGRELIEHYDHGYLITSSHSTGSGDHHGWLVKTDINGNELWDLEFGIDPDQVFIDKTLYDDDGNIYIFGQLKQPDLPHEYPLIVKLNACGEKQWCQLLVGGSNIEYGYFTDAVLLDNGDLLGLASYPDSEQFDMIYLFCLSSEGEYRRRRSYASCSNYPFFAVRLGYTLSKFSDMYIISGYVYSPYPGGNPYHAYLRPMFIGIDENFDEQWVIEFGIGDSLLGQAYKTIQINDSLFMGVGRHRMPGDQESWIMFYNTNGEEVGYKLLDDVQFGPEIMENLIFDLERIDNNQFLATGGFMYEVEDNYAWGEMVIDTAGNVYNYAIRENSAGGGTYLVKTFDNKYTIACSYKTPNTNYDIMLYKINKNLEQDTIYPGNYTYDSLCEDTIESGVIELAGCDIITSIGEIPTMEEYLEKMQTIGITASPNPSNTGEVMLEFENTEMLPESAPLIPPEGGTGPSLIVCNMLGKKIHEERVYRYQGASHINVSNWPAGMYIATIFSNGQVKGKCKVVVSR